MKDDVYQKLWSWAALVQLTFIVGLFVRTTSGAKPSELFAGLVVNAITVPALGLPVDLTLGILVLLLTLHWSSRHKVDPWTIRVPTFKFASIEIIVNSLLGKQYKLLTFLGAHVLALIATVQMTVRYFESKIYLRSGELVIPGGWSHFDYVTVSAAAARGMLKFGDHNLGVEHFSVLPWLYASIAVVYGVLFVAVTWSVFRPARPVGGSERLALRNPDSTTGA